MARRNLDADAQEIATLERFFGQGRFSGQIAVEALRADLPRRIADVRQHVPPMRRAQVIRDLCVIALADGKADDAERHVIADIAREFEVDASIARWSGPPSSTEAARFRPSGRPRAWSKAAPG